MVVFTCYDNFESMMTCIYDAWAARLGHSNIRLQTEPVGNLELFCEYRHIDTEMEKVQKVIRSIHKKSLFRRISMYMLPPCLLMRKSWTEFTVFWCWALPVETLCWICSISRRYRPFLNCSEVYIMKHTNSENLFALTVWKTRFYSLSLNRNLMC